MNTMRPATGRPSGALPSLLAAAVVAIVLGIVGMHALNTHGAMNNINHATMTNPMTGMTGAQADMSAGPATSDSPVVSASVSTTAPDGGNGHTMGSMVLLCLAMLAATAGALLLLTLGLPRMPRMWAHLPIARTSVSRWVTARLGTGPPPVWRFSVIRC